MKSYVSPRVRSLHLILYPDLFAIVKQAVDDYMIGHGHRLDAETTFALAAVYVRFALDTLMMTRAPTLFAMIVLRRTMWFIEDAVAKPNLVMQTEDIVGTPGTPDEDRRAVIGRVRDCAMEVEKFVREHPGCTKGDILLGNGRPRQVIEQAIEACIACGVVATVPSGDGFVYVTTPQQQDPEAPGEPGHVAKCPADSGKPTDPKLADYLQTKKLVKQIETFVAMNPGCSRQMILGSVRSGKQEIMSALTIAVKHLGSIERRNEIGHRGERYYATKAKP